MNKIFRKIGRFFRRHWKAITIVVVAIILIVVVTSLVKHFAGGSSNPSTGAGNGSSTAFTGNSGGENGIVTVEGQSVGIFDTKDDAEANPITVTAGVKSMTVNGDNAQVSTNIGSINHVSGKDYELNLDGLADGTIATITVKTGGDGSFIGQRLGNDVETHYLTVNVSNPNATPAGTSGGNASTGTAPNSTSSVPTGTVHFGDTTFQTYGSEAEAQSVVANDHNKFTIPTNMAKNLVLTAEPSEGTARIWASVCMVDDVDETGMESRMNADSNWSATFDLSKYAGHQVTIVLKAENGMALSNGYSYVSFFVPQFEVEEEYVAPIVVN